MRGGRKKSRFKKAASSTLSSSPKTKVQFVKVDASALIKEFSGLVRLVRELRFGRVETGETGESRSAVSLSSLESIPGRVGPVVSFTEPV